MANAGRGFLYITFAKAYFMLAGFATQVALSHFLGKKGFGDYSVVTRSVSLINNIVVAATIAGVARLVVEEEGRDGLVTRAALKMQALVGACLVGALLLLSPSFGEFILDPSLVPLVRAMLGVTLAYTLYTVFVGTANGRREFHKQAGLDITFSTLKTGLLVAAAALGFGVRGTIFGFVAAALSVTVIASLVVGIGPRPSDAPPFRSSRFGSFFGKMLFYVAGLNLLLVLDSLLLKRQVALAVIAKGASEAEAATQSSTLLGVYAAVQALSQLPYQGVIAIAFVIFPLISKATFAKDAERTRAYVAGTLRYTLLLGAAIAVPFLANPTATLRLPFPASYAQGAPALQWLALAGLGLGLLSVMGSILNGAGHVFDATVSLAGAIVVIGVVATLEIPRAADPLFAAALSTLAGIATGIAIGALFMRRRFRSFLPMASLLRVALALALSILVGRLIPDGGKVFTLFECAVSEVVLLASLLVTKEFSSADFKNLRQLARGT